MKNPSVRFTLAIEILILCEKNKELNSVEIASMIDTSPVFTRQIMLDLQKGGLIQSKKGGKGGITLLKDINDITLLEVYNCTEKDEQFIGFTNPLQNGKYSKNQLAYHKALISDLSIIPQTFEKEFKRHTVGEYYRSYYKK